MRLIIVSNRLPVTMEKTNGRWTTRAGSGGLVSALTPSMKRYGGVWIGWPGAHDQPGLDVERNLRGFGGGAGFELRGVPLEADEVEGFYHGFSNEIIWPLFHDLQSRCNFDPTYWNIYKRVNRKFAEVTAASIRHDDYIWAHDYHLMLFGAECRRRGVRNKLGFFLHIPFPAPDIFLKLPWRNELIESLLAYDLLGFQAHRDLLNFELNLRALFKKVHIRRREGLVHVEFGGHSARLGVFPIGIDDEDFAARAATDDAIKLWKRIRSEQPDRQIILGLDRLDYTKGIRFRLDAFRLALEKYPDLHRKVVFFQIVIPSREGVEEYRELKAELEQMVSEINGKYTDPGWVPIHHVYRSLNPVELIAYYRAADVNVVTPLKDGMNLVCKEYCACQLDGNGALVLSEFAGAAADLKRGALLVNPCDIEGVAEAIYQAVTMKRGERRRRMRSLKRLIHQKNVFWWIGAFLHAGKVDLAPPAKPAARETVAVS